MYIIYNCLTNSPFVTASCNVLKALDIPFQNLSSESTFVFHGGYYGRLTKLENFIFANVYNIALAVKNNGILLALEEDSYANLAFTLNLIKSNQSVKDFLYHQLQNHNIKLDLEALHEYVTYFPQVLENKLDTIKTNIQFHFGNTIMQPSILPKNPISNAREGISTCLYYSNRHFDCNTKQEYGVLKPLFELVGLKSFTTSFSMQSFQNLLDIDSEKAYKKSGEAMYAGIDLGVDFLCVFSDYLFNMFEKQRNLCIKYCKRDSIAIPILNLAQVLLISLGKEQEAGLELHNVKPDFIKANSAIA